MKDIAATTCDWLGFLWGGVLEGGGDGERKWLDMLWIDLGVWWRFGDVVFWVVFLFLFCSGCDIKR